jgi:hypothetical protein
MFVSWEQTDFYKIGKSEVHNYRFRQSPLLEGNNERTIQQYYRPRYFLFSATAGKAFSTTNAGQAGTVVTSETDKRQKHR